MKILVCGGRDFTDWPYAQTILEHVVARHGVTELVHGAARGADAIAAEWAKTRGFIKVHACPPDWTKHGRAAGPLRNQAMLDEHPDIELVIAFPGGRGTADMVARARAAGVRVLEFPAI